VVKFTDEIQLTMAITLQPERMDGKVKEGHAGVMEDVHSGQSLILTSVEVRGNHSAYLRQL
jgi:hypothetical protein